MDLRARRHRVLLACRRVGREQSIRRQPTLARGLCGVFYSLRKRKLVGLLSLQLMVVVGNHLAELGQLLDLFSLCDGLQLNLLLLSLEADDLLLVILKGLLALEELLVFLLPVLDFVLYLLVEAVDDQLLLGLDITELFSPLLG